MPKSEVFAETFAMLRSVLEPHAGRLLVGADAPGDYQLSSRSMKDSAGRPLFVAAVQIKKNYVSFHLMPVYACPDLLDGISPALRKRMQGKSCFNFTSIEPAQLQQLAELTQSGFDRFRQDKAPFGERG
jgi:hypothetical protein